MKSWWGKYTDENITARSLTSLIFACNGRPKYYCEVFNFVDLCMQWSTTARTRVSDATAGMFAIKYFNPLKLHPLSGNIFRKWSSYFYLFIHKHLIIMWSPTVNFIVVRTLLLTSGLHLFFSSANKIILGLTKKTKKIMLADSSSSTDDWVD